MPSGPPSKFTQELADQICELVADGASLRSVCRDLNLVRRTVRAWRGQFPEFDAQYARAWAEGMDVLAEEIIDISDDSTGDEKFITDSNGKVIPVCNTEFVQRSKLRVDTRKWIMSKIAPKNYGDKTTTAITGADGQNLPITLLISQKESK